MAPMVIILLMCVCSLGRSVAWLCGVDKYRPYAVQLGGAVRLILLSARCHFSPDLLCAMSTFLGTSIPVSSITLHTDADKVESN